MNEVALRLSQIYRENKISKENIAKSQVTWLKIVS